MSAAKVGAAAHPAEMPTAKPGAPTHCPGERRWMAPTLETAARKRPAPKAAINDRRIVVVKGW